MARADVPGVGWVSGAGVGFVSLAKVQSRGSCDKRPHRSPTLYLERALAPKSPLFIQCWRVSFRASWQTSSPTVETIWALKEILEIFDASPQVQESLSNPSIGCVQTIRETFLGASRQCWARLARQKQAKPLSERGF
jgi:hypothetical protein